MSEYGFIAISRSLFDHDFWTTNRVFSFAEAWIDLIQMARWEQGTVLFKSNVVAVERGQIITAERFLATKWGWSRSKLRAFLDLLKNSQMIDQQKTAKKTTITLCNFDKYNVPRTTKKTDKEPQKNHRKTAERPNKNKYNNYNNTTPPISPPGGDAEQQEDWRADYQVYLDQLRQAYKKAKADDRWVQQRESYHPNLDVRRSLEKACADYWATDEGWNKKLKSGAQKINWRSTFNTALSVKSNQVYKPRTDPQTNETQIF